MGCRLQQPQSGQFVLVNGGWKGGKSEKKKKKKRKKGKKKVERDGILAFKTYGVLYST